MHINKMKSPALFKLIKSVLIAACIATSFSGCVTSIPQFASYRPPNSDANFGIEVHPILTSVVGRCEAVELRINGELVAVSRARFGLTTYDFPTAEGIYNGKRIRMEIQYLGQKFMQPEIVFPVDVFVGAERACRLTVVIK